MIEFTFVGVIGGYSNLNAAQIGFSMDRLQVVSTSVPQILSFELNEWTLANLLNSTDLNATIPNLNPVEAEFIDEQIWFWDHLQNRAVVYEGGAVTAASLGGPALTIYGAVARLGQEYVVAGPAPNELTLLSMNANATFDLIDTYSGGPKDTVADVSNLVSAQIGTREFVVAGSYSENGLSSFERQGDDLVLIDSIGSKDGLWIAGMSDLEIVEVAGQSFVIASSANASSIISVRLNAEGVFFPADQIWDSRASRFANVTELATFEWRDRDFIIAGGNDLGLSLIEVLPTGRLFDHTSIAQNTDWNIGSLASLAAQVVGDEVQIFASGSLGEGVAQLSIDLSRTGGATLGTDSADVLTGGWMDDVILGGDGDDTLIGRAGDDVLIDGAGSDVLTGENGADVFVFDGDGTKDKIADFAKGEDRIHLGGWGNLYAWSALSISETSYGAKIVWGDELLEIFTKNSRPIDVESWGADDFLF